MGHKPFLILAATLVLMAASLTCNLATGKLDEASEVEVTTEVPAKESTKAPPTDIPEDSSPTILTDETQSAGNVVLSDEYRCAEGGYAFKSIPEYTTQEYFGRVMMEGSDATEAHGPFILLIGELNEEEKTSDQLYDDFIAEMELDKDETVNILDQKEVIVDGHPGTLVDLEGQEVVERVVIVAVSPIQQFSMLAVAPTERWDEIEPLFDSVLASVYFFEPEGGNIPSFGEDGTASEDIPDSPESDPGDAYFMITDQEGTLIVMEENYTIEDQYQSAPEETIIGLVSKNQEYTIILALPKDMSNNDMLSLIAYDPYASIKAPSAAVYIGDVLYTAKTDGLIIFDEITAETISGTFFFEAANAEDPSEVISVMGTFVKLILPE